jgi:EmrB/QacA subfamily drug resistance transporter
MTMTTESAAAKEDMSGVWLVLTMASICMTVVAYNTTAVITALPNLKADFDLRPTTLQWVMSLYTITAATLVPILGRLGDLFGKMNVFVFGMLVFAIGSAIVAVSWNGGILLVGRFGQGVGAATLFGTSLAVLSSATPESHRSFVVGFWGAMIGLGMSLGPIIGGLFADFISWRGIFVCDLILLAISFYIAMRVIKAGYVPRPQSDKVKVDYAGGIALIFVLGPLAFALNNGSELGWTSAPTLIAFAITILAAILFVMVERRVAEPLIQLNYFRHRRYLAATLGMFFASIVLLGFLYYFSLFVQSPDTLDMSPVIAGAAVLPASSVMFVLSVTAPRVLAPYSYRWPIAIGMACYAIAGFLLYDTSNGSSYAEIWWKLLILGLGFGLTIPLLPRIGLRVLPEEHSGQGSGVINTYLYFGATMGIVLGGLATALTVRATVWEVVDALPVATSQHQALVTTVAQGSAIEVQEMLATLGADASAALRSALRAVRDDAFDNVMLVCAVSGLIGLALVLWLMRGPVPPTHDAARLVPSVSAKD